MESDAFCPTDLLNSDCALRAFSASSLAFFCASRYLEIAAIAAPIATESPNVSVPIRTFAATLEPHKARVKVCWADRHALVAAVRMPICLTFIRLIASDADSRPITTDSACASLRWIWSSFSFSFVKVPTTPTPAAYNPIIPRNRAAEPYMLDFKAAFCCSRCSCCNSRARLRAFVS